MKTPSSHDSVHDLHLFSPKLQSVKQETQKSLFILEFTVPEQATSIGKINAELAQTTYNVHKILSTGD